MTNDLRDSFLQRARDLMVRIRDATSVGDIENCHEALGKLNFLFAKHIKDKNNMELFYFQFLSKMENLVDQKFEDILTKFVYGTEDTGS